MYITCKSDIYCNMALPRCRPPNNMTGISFPYILTNPSWPICDVTLQAWVQTFGSDAWKVAFPWNTSFTQLLDYHGVLLPGCVLTSLLALPHVLLDTWMLQGQSSIFSIHSHFLNDFSLQTRKTTFVLMDSKLITPPVWTSHPNLTRGIQLGIT